MSHSIQVIESIRRELEKRYPSQDGYEYVIEEKLLQSQLNYQPDIQVVDQSGEIVCVVEIGYTRPEKLAWYREKQIPDIRWYSRDRKFVNPDEHVLLTKVRYEPPKEEIWREVDIDQYDGIFCEDCHSEYLEAMREELGNGVSESELMDATEDRYLAEATIYGELWCNGSRWFCVWQCDECGLCYFMTGDSLEGMLDLERFQSLAGGFSYDKFLSIHYKESDQLKDYRSEEIVEEVMRRALYEDLKKKATFDELQRYVLQRYSYDIEYHRIAAVPSSYPQLH